VQNPISLFQIWKKSEEFNSEAGGNSGNLIEEFRIFCFTQLKRAFVHDYLAVVFKKCFLIFVVN
jgi:hypothetical protein